MNHKTGAHCDRCAPKPRMTTSPAEHQTERDFQKQVVALANLAGWRTYHTHDSRRSNPGFPDLVLVHRSQGRLIFAELKAQKGKLRTEQAEWLSDLWQITEGREWAEVYVWRPSDWASIEATLTKRYERAA